jgi:hypothetical protein
MKLEPVEIGPEEVLVDYEANVREKKEVKKGHFYDDVKQNQSVNSLADSIRKNGILYPP